jgi:tRNA A37 threonylcarbamoyladenosine dehydratase
MELKQSMELTRPMELMWLMELTRQWNSHSHGTEVNIMEDRFSRSRMLLGDEAMKKLAASRVAVFGVGGVGGYVTEALARSGVGEIDLIDNDEVVLSNLNRQIIATMDTIGRNKVDVMAERILSINPDAVVHRHKCFYLPETAGQFDFSAYDYVVDAIDTVTGKIQLVLQAKEAGVPIISAMGAGNKLDPSAFEVADIYETSIDPLARVMRRELKKRGVKSLKVVYSREKPLQPEVSGGSIQDSMQDSEERAGDHPEEKNPAGTGEREGKNPAGTDEGEGKKPAEIGEKGEKTRPRRSTPGSLPFVPSVAGLIIAGEVIRDLCEAGGGIRRDV